MKFIVELTERMVRTFAFECEVKPEQSYLEMCEEAEDKFSFLDEEERKKILIETIDSKWKAEANIDNG